MTLLLCLCIVCIDQELVNGLLNLLQLFLQSVVLMLLLGEPHICQVREAVSEQSKASELVTAEWKV